MYTQVKCTGREGFRAAGGGGGGGDPTERRGMGFASTQLFHSLVLTMAKSSQTPTLNELLQEGLCHVAGPPPPPPSGVLATLPLACPVPGRQA